jgi:hypothetical protein
MKQPAHCKYTPFEAYLRSVPDEQRELVMTFEQIEHVMASSLPKTAYQRQTYWGNGIPSGLSHKNAWLHAGWMVASADLVEKRVNFVRGGQEH